MYAPIVVFAFNRPNHLHQTLDALAQNELASQSAITIFCDGPRNDEERTLTDAVRMVAKSACGFASLRVVERAQNMGCAASVIDGLTRMFALHDRIIVIEDDILCSPYTLSFLNHGLDFYASDFRIFNISAWSPPPAHFPIPQSYPHDIYAIPRFNCWGWASWRNRFVHLDWGVSDYSQFKRSPVLRESFNAGGDDLSGMLDDQMAGHIDTWDIRADYGRFKQAQLGINPVMAYVTNIGFGSGTHTVCFTDRYDCDVSLAKAEPRFVRDIQPDAEVIVRYKKFYEPAPVGLVQRVKISLRNLIRRIEGGWSGA